MIGSPPGNILQYLFLAERINQLEDYKNKAFIEVGSGNGYLSRVLLKKGMKGVGYDLNKSACENNESYNAQYIQEEQYKIVHGDFLAEKAHLKADIIISSMVIEHLDNHELKAYFEKCSQMVSANGLIIVLVPSSMKHWGIEDEIAGHFKRYEYDDFTKISKDFGFSINYIAGLTYPISNMLFQVSNSVIKKNESNLIGKSQKEKTVYTGNREVKYKTQFPKYLNVILNPVILYPFHILQKLFKKNKNALVIYNEFTLK